MEKVIAVVVTYNRMQLLEECIKALQSQTRKPDTILVINNGSTDNTEYWLRNQKNIHFITQKNTGSGGGFSTAIKEAYNMGATWVWCMDDDGYPKADALQQLLDADNGSLRLMNCAVINKENKKDFVWKTDKYKNIEEVDTDIIEGIGHPFNGTLIHRNIIERVGVPGKQYFIWGDETEYYYRITKQSQIPVCTVAKSIHYHPATAFSLKQEWDFKSGWKMYYYIRNRFHIHNAKFGNRAIALLNYSVFLLAFAGITLLYQKNNKLKKLSFIAWPVADAFNKNFEAQPNLILTKLNQRHSASILKTANQNIKDFTLRLLAPLGILKTGRPTATA